MSIYKNFKENPPEYGTRIVAISPIYPVGDPMRVRVVTVFDCAMTEIEVYATVDDVEAQAMSMVSR